MLHLIPLFRRHSTSDKQALLRVRDEERQRAIRDAIEPLEQRMLLSVVTIANSTTVEGQPAAFIVTLDSPATTNTNVGYITTNKTARAPVNYSAAKGTVTIPAGQTTGVITVSTRDDGMYTGSKTFQVKLRGSRGVKLGKPNLAIGTITNADAAPVVSFVNPNPTITRPTRGTRPLTFQVRLSAATDTKTVLSYSTEDATALAGRDYKPISKRITIAPKKTAAVIKVNVIGFKTAAPSRVFMLNVSGPSTASAAGTILGSPNLPEGNVVSASNLTVFGGSTAGITVSLNQRPATPVTVAYTTAPGTAVAGTDFTPTSGTLTFAAGELTKLIKINTLVETQGAPDKVFTVNLSSPTNASLGTSTGTVTITANPASVTHLSVSDVSVAPAAGATANFVVSLSGAALAPVFAHYSTADGTAVAGRDYIASSGDLTFQPGELTKTVAVPVTAIGNGTFTLTIGQPVNAPITKGTGTATITGNVTPPPVIGPNDGQGVKFSNFTWTGNAGAKQNQTLNYDLTSSRTTAIGPMQLRIFFAPQGADLTQQTPVKTVDVGTISAGATVSGSVALTAASPAPGSGFYQYYVQAVVGNTVYDQVSSVLLQY